MITPNTRIILLKCPITLSNKHQITFASKEAQFNYFYNLSKLEEDDCSYQRKDNVIRFPAHFDTLQEYNYCMYQNENYGNKWFYAFITNMNYVNDNCTYISIKTDVFQTWQFDLTWKKSFIEREHVLDDTIGLHTIQENLDVGEVIEENETYIQDLATDYYYIVTSSYNPALTNKEFDGVNKINGSIIGTNIFAFETTNVGTVSLRHFIQACNTAGKVESIENLFILPKMLIDAIGTRSQTFNYDGATVNYYIVEKNNLDYDSADNGIEFSFPISALRSFSDFQPKNNKLYCYPYNYLLVNNNCGNYNIYKYEDFFNNNEITPNIIFAMQMSYAIGLSCRLIPRGYKKLDYNFDEMLPLGKFPTCSWSSDAFTNWLTSNAVNIVTSVATTAVSIGTGNVAGTFAGVASLIGQFNQASLLPNISGGNNTGDVNFAMKTNSFYFHFMRAKTEYLQQIDNFFSLYGYKVNELKLPNLTNRPNWNYIKTVGANILANIPQLDLAEIKEMFDNGITLWHNTSTFLDYSQNNN